jgi:hypothetical protein
MVAEEIQELAREDMIKGSDGAVDASFSFALSI